MAALGSSHGTTLTSVRSELTASCGINYDKSVSESICELKEYGTHSPGVPLVLNLFPIGCRKIEVTVEVTVRVRDIDTSLRVI